MRRGSISWLVLLVALGGGLGLGLFYAWRVNPVIDTNTAPWQLPEQGQQEYMVAISLSYAKDHDLLAAVQHLEDLRLGGKDTWQAVADTACDLARSNYASTTTGLTAIQSMMKLYEGQGVTGCASTLLPISTLTPVPTPTSVSPTETLPPPATKTPQPTLGATFTPATAVIQPSATPAGEFRLATVEAFCDAQNAGVIQVFVQDVDGTGIPGIGVQIMSGTDKDNFFTGLKPERDPGYADFQMTADESYTVSLPGIGGQSQPIQAVDCTADSGGKVLTSYRVYFRRAPRG